MGPQIEHLRTRSQNLCTLHAAPVAAPYDVRPTESRRGDFGVHHRGVDFLLRGRSGEVAWERSSLRGRTGDFALHTHGNGSLVASARLLDYRVQTSSFARISGLNSHVHSGETQFGNEISSTQGIRCSR